MSKFNRHRTEQFSLGDVVDTVVSPVSDVASVVVSPVTSVLGAVTDVMAPIRKLSMSLLGSAFSVFGSTTNELLSSTLGINLSQLVLIAGIGGALLLVVWLMMVL